MNAKLLLRVLTAACLAGSLRAQDYFVDADAAPGGDGTSWAQAFLHLQDALAAAEGPVEIWVAEGVYRPDQGSGDRSATFSLESGFILYGGFDGTEATLADRDPQLHPTLLDGDLLGDDLEGFVNYGENAHHVITCVGSSTEVRVDGFVVRGGNSLDSPVAAGLGAGLLAQTSVMTVSECRFEVNDGNGASFDLDGVTQVVDCVFEGNRATDAGGLFCGRGSALVRACRFIDNVATSGSGGGAYISLNKLTQVGEVDDCVFQGNDASWRGGGLFTSSSFSGGSNEIRITGCTFADNSALEGGGSYHRGSAGSLVNDRLEARGCRYQRNTAVKFGAGAGAGGGMMSEGLGLTVVDTLFESNVARRGGGYDDQGNEYLRMYNCRLLGNSASMNDGGGLRTQTTAVTLVNLAVAGNSSAAWGGGVMLASSNAFMHPRLSNLVVYGNTGTVGGGVWLDDDQIELYNSILWGNSDASGAGLTAQLHGSPQLEACCVQGWDGSLGGTNNFGADPALTKPEGCDGIVGTVDDDFRLMPTSPCLSAGSLSLLPPDLADLDGDGDQLEPTPLDLDRLPRATRGLEIGPYEMNGELPSKYCVSKTNSLGCVPEICSSGRASISGVNDFMLQASNVKSNELGVFVWSLSPAATPFAGAIFCLGSRVSLEAPVSSGGSTSSTDCSGSYSHHFTQAQMSTHGLTAGLRVFCQFVSRDSGFEGDAAKVGLTDALEFELGP